MLCASPRQHRNGFYLILIGANSLLPLPVYSKKTDQDQKIDILNKAQCGNDFFEVSKIENDNHFQFSFLAFAFDGEQAFDMVS